MQSRVSLLLLVLAALAVIVAATASDRVVQYNRDVSPPNWERLSRASPSDKVTFMFSLVQHNMDELTRRATEISDPNHDNYVNFMTIDEIAQLTGPTPAELQRVYTMLHMFGIHQSEMEFKAGEALKVSTSVAAAERLFSTEFYNFQHSLTGTRTIKQFGEWSLPSGLADLVTMTLGVSTFPTIEGKMIIKNAIQKIKADRAKRLAAATPDAPEPAWVPQALAEIYTFPTDIKPLSTPNITAGVIEFIAESFNQTDLTVFGRQVGRPVVHPTKEHIYGNTSVGEGALEASLDIQWLEGINPGATPWFWLESGELWLYSYTVEALAKGTAGPQIISMSYGLPESMQCSYFNNATCQPLGVDWRGYVVATNRQFMKLAAIGVTSIICSQDRGVYEPHRIPGYKQVGQQVAPFEPEYPGTSDWVTSVGATEFASPQYNLKNPPPACVGASWQCVSNGTEQAVGYDISGYKSGGGFSNASPRPQWQSTAVSAYLSSGVTLPANASVWNHTSRGYPDIAALGYNAIIIDQGDAELVSGTSLSTPIIAAFFAYLADQFKTKTGMNLGFLSPMLYSAYVTQPNVFHDITMGDNCQSDPCAGDGFLAYKGWDPVTGLGSPVYKNWQSYIGQLADKVLARRAKQASSL